MVERDLTEMTAEEFEALIDRYIERSSRRDDEIPAEVFLKLLFEPPVERVQETIQLTDELTPSYSDSQTPLSVIATVVDGQLFLETHPESPLTAEGSTIWLEDGKELFIQLLPA